MKQGDAGMWLLFSKPEYWSFVSTESKNSNDDNSYWCSNEKGIEHPAG